MTPQLIALLLSAMGIFIFVTLGLAARAAGWSPLFEQVTGVVYAGFLAFKYFSSWMFYGEGEPFIPLHLCNLAEIVACLSLLTRWYWFRSLLYFWSLGTVIVFITPEPPTAPGTLAYAVFWFSHALILSVTAYELIVAGFRPRLKDLGMAAAVTLGYVGLVLPINIISGTNYGYVGPVEPSVPTLIDYLGPWPLRVIWIVLIGTLVFTLAWAPWAIHYRLRNGQKGRFL